MALIESQNLRIKKHLEAGRSLTALDGLHLFNCFRLGARIHNLKGQGLNIETEMITIISDGKEKRIAKYSLAK